MQDPHLSKCISLCKIHCRTFINLCHFAYNMCTLENVIQIVNINTQGLYRICDNCHMLFFYKMLQQWLDMAWCQSVNSLKPRQNRRYFADDVFKCNFLNGNVWIQIKISLKFVPKGPINNVSALVQIMAWHRTGNKPLSEPMMTQFNDAYMRHSASMTQLSLFTMQCIWAWRKRELFSMMHICDTRSVWVEQILQEGFYKISGLD